MKKQKHLADGLLEILLEKKLVGKGEDSDLKDDFEGHSTEHFQDFLLEEGVVDKEELLEVLEQYFGVRGVDVLGEMFNHDLLTMFPREVLIENVCIPYQREGQILFVIVGDPNNADIEMALGEYVSYDIHFFVGIPRHINVMIKDFYPEPPYEDEYEETIEREQEERELTFEEEE